MSTHTQTPETPERGRDRIDGFALPATILAMVVVGGLITGGVFLANQETQVAASAEYSTEAFLAAERGLAYAIGNTTRPEYEAIGEGNEIELSVDPGSSGGVETQSTVRIRSLGNNLYFVESTGRVIGAGKYGGATHRLASMVRPISMTLNVNSALKTMGAVSVSGTGLISGADHTPTGWTGCDAADDLPGVISSAPSGTQGGGDVDGDPPFVQDPSMDPDEFLQFGSMHYDDIAAAADIKVAGGNINPAPSTNPDGTCNTSDPNNFGSATGACQNHFPVIHVQGNASLQGDGQGIMVVDGDFVAQGGGRFNGIVIVKGKLLTGGGNGGVTGGIMVYNDGSPTTTYMVNGNGVALYSKCAIERSLAGASAFNRIYPISERSWVDLSGTGTLTY